MSKAQEPDFLRVSRTGGGSARVKIKTSSPVTVLMSWCRLTTFMPVTSLIIASKSGRAVSSRWVRTCLSKSLPFSAGQRLDQMLLGRGQDALQADHEEIIDQVGANVLGPASHIFLLEARDPFADGGFDFALGFHVDLEGDPRPAGSHTARTVRRWRPTPGSSVLQAVEESSYRKERQFSCYFRQD